jgi:serine/threonine protein kinase
MASEPPAIGATFAGYRIVRLLGRGRAGATYVALSAAGVPVVLRVLPDAGPDVADALLREQRRAVAVRHPNIAPVLDAGVEDGAFYVVRPFVPGPSLAVASVGPLHRLRLLSTVAEAVGAAHEQGLVHGSLRPENILLAGEAWPMVVDFGALTSTRPALERRDLTAPEVEHGAEPTAAADVYGLGAMARGALPPPPRAMAYRRRPQTGLWHSISEEPAERPPMRLLEQYLRLASDLGRGNLELERRSSQLPPEREPPVRSAGPRGRDLGPASPPTDDRPSAVPHPRAAKPPSFALGHRPRAVVNTGFEQARKRGHRLAPTTWLRPHTPYEFTLDVGPKDPANIETKPTSLPAKLRTGTRLTVTVNPVGGDVEMPADGRMGELIVRPDGSAEAVDTKDGRLRFPLRTREAGTFRLRASILDGATLVQSRLVTAQVAAPAARRRGAGQRSDVDYVLATDLTPAAIAPLADAADVSLMFNGDDGTHALQVVARDNATDELVSHHATYDAAELQTAVRYVRKALHQVAWGSEAAWKEGEHEYCYDNPDPARLKEDLCRLAIRGYRLYDQLVNELAGGPGKAFVDFQSSMRPPRRIQLASQRNAKLLLPIAFFYDAPIETNLPLAEYRLCDIYNKPSVAQAPCFQGLCPHYGEDDVICPSGFWGFRHVIGLPLSLPTGTQATAVQAATAITYNQGPAVAMAVSTDPLFALRPEHEDAVKALVDPGRWRYADTRAKTIALLQATDSQLFYFYCHGGIQGGTPFLQVGRKTERGITRDVFRSPKIRWEDPSRPLVFINGCHTAALEPQQLFDFVSALAENASAGGVVGTEITNFEPLAGTFATACLRRFLAGETLGEAIRAARLDLLQAGNPLGLIYTPFAMPSLRLVAA